MINIPSQSFVSVCTQLPPKPKKRNLFSYNHNHSGCSDNSVITSPITGFETYLNHPIILKFSEYCFRSQLHSLKRVILRVYSVQASSSLVKRVFSRAGLILSSR